MEDFWKRAKTFAEEAAKKSQSLTTSSATSRIADLVSETAKKSKELAAEASKKADEIKSAALRQADQIKSFSDNISIPPQFSAIAAAATSSTVAPPVENLERFGITDDLRLIELNLIATELGQIALSSATLNDCIQFFFIVSHRIVGEHTRELKFSIMGFSSLILFMFCSFYILQPMMNLIARSTPVGKPVNQMYVVFILLGALVMAGITDMIGLTFLIGPLIWGLIIPSGPPLGTTLVEKCELIISEFLLPFFFVYMGMTTNLAALDDWRECITMQLIFFAGDITKVVACVLVSMIYNIKPKHGTVLGLMLNIKGIPHLIAFSKLHQLKLLDDETLSHLVIGLAALNTRVSNLIPKF